jgi:hypothetical protein
LSRPPRDIRLHVLLDARAKKMLEELAARHRRSMGDVVRLAIERIYQIDMMKAGAGVAQGASRAAGSSGDPRRR